MIDLDAVRAYRGPALLRGETFVYLPPAPALSPYLANYTITSPAVIPGDYTILPTASATLVYAVDPGGLYGNLRGVNTRAAAVGEPAGRFSLLVLIELHPGGLYHLLGVPQQELLDDAFSLDEIDLRLHRQIEGCLLAAHSIWAVKNGLDRIFLSRLGDTAPDPTLRQAVGLLRGSNGNISTQALSGSVYYSGKHLNRIFKRQLGVGVKAFSRIVRVNYAVRLMQSGNFRLADVAAAAGYYDQSHFDRDFQLLCGVSPGSYRRNLSIFYNDAFKL